ncbi:hypothetical protein RUM44_008909 [Polyplax serrata]|uniref:Uncharacterized protein n=1 Tax=Polyplax serrata TaxID=468196 RepID=A0ABR1ARU2_POLSC
MFDSRTATETVTVTMADVLQLRPGGLKEEEVWSLLCQSVQTLQDLFLPGKTFHYDNSIPVVTPKTLCICNSGRIRLTQVVHYVDVDHDPFLAPEYLQLEKYQREAQALDQEKMWIYSLGKTLDLSLNRTRTEVGSKSLRVVLELMTKVDPSVRSSLMTLFQVIFEYYNTSVLKKPLTHLVMGLYREVLGVSRQHQCLPINSIAMYKGDNGAIQLKLLEEPAVFTVAKGNASNCRKSNKILSVTKGTPAVGKNPVQRAPSRLYSGMNAPNKQTSVSTICTGPEFIVRGSEPPKTVFLGNIKPSRCHKLTVVLLTGERLKVFCHPFDTLCGELFEAVVRVARIEDNYIFGLASMMNGDFVFLPNETKVNKVAPLEWKDPKKTTKENECHFVLYVRVKFFLPDLRGVRSRQTKHLIYLQLRRSLLEKQISCRSNELINLAGLALQAEFGNFRPDEHGSQPYFLIDHYLPEELEDENSILESKLQESHRSRSGLNRWRAEEVFVSLVQRLPEYGCHHHTGLCLSKSSTTPAWVTVSPKGISICQKKNDSHKRESFKIITWKNIERFSCKEGLFRLIPKNIAPQKETVYKFQMTGNKSFFLFSLAAFHHRFFLHLKIDSSPLDALEKEFGISTSGRGKAHFHFGNELNISGKGVGLGHSEGNKGPALRQQKHESEESFLSEGERRNEKSQTVSPSAVEKKRLPKGPRDAYVIDLSIRSCQEDFNYNSHESISPNLANRFDTAPWENERILKRVHRSKDKYGSYGLEVIEGSNGGILVENIFKRSTETEMEDIKRGDELIAVNGICLLNLKFSEALNVLKSAGNDIEILVSRRPMEVIKKKEKKIDFECMRRIRFDTADESDALTSTSLPTSN